MITEENKNNIPLQDTSEWRQNNNIIKNVSWLARIIVLSNKAMTSFFPSIVIQTLLSILFPFSNICYAFFIFKRLKQKRT